MSIRVSARDEPFCNLVLGQTFNAKTFEEGVHVFDPGFEVKVSDVSSSVSQSKVVQSNTDIRDLLDVSGDFSLKIESGVFGIGVGAKYLKERRKEIGVTEVFVFIRYKTVNKTIDDRRSTIRRDLSSFAPEKIGTHVVETVTYGGEMIATIKLKTAVSTKRFETNKTGALSAIVRGVCGLRAHLEGCFGECQSTDFIEINYYGTDQPVMSLTPKDLLQHIKSFPERMKVADGCPGVPIRLTLQPLAAMRIQHGITYRKNTTHGLPRLMEKFEAQYHDVRSCCEDLERQVDGKECHEDILKLSKSAQVVLEKFREAIAMLNLEGDEVPFHASLEAYKNALEGRPLTRKFMAEWEKLLKLHTGIIKTELKDGEPLTVLLFGKTGNGKSSVANQILGEERFEASNSARSCTNRYRAEERKEDRKICVFDTPGFMEVKRGSSPEKELDGLVHELKDVDKLVDGIDALLLVARYGSRMTDEECKSLLVPAKVFGEEANQHTILVLTHGDQAVSDAQREGIPVNDVVQKWLTSLQDDLRKFVFSEIESRVVLFDNSPPRVGAASEVQVSQVSRLVEMIDAMREERDGRFTLELTDDIFSAWFKATSSPSVGVALLIILAFVMVLRKLLK